MKSPQLRGRQRFGSSTLALQRGLFAFVGFTLVLVLARPSTAQFAGALPPMIPDEQPSDFDQAQRRKLSNVPGAIEVLDAGERAHRFGDFAEALDHYARLLELAPGNVLALRRQCQVQAALGAFDRADDSCRQAVQRWPTAPNMRSLVGALMARPGLLDVATLAAAETMASRALDQKPKQLWGYAAFADIAYRLGDAALLDHYAAKLGEVAPGHAAVARAETLREELRSAHSREWSEDAWLFAWLLLAVIVVSTLAHAARSTWRSRHRRVVAAVGCYWLAMTLSGPLQAQELFGDWPIDREDPESSVPSSEQRDQNPLQFGYFVMDVSTLAEAATRADDHPLAIRYYRALIKAVPEHAAARRKLCESYRANAQIPEAIAACRAVLTSRGVQISDHLAFARLVLYEQPSPTHLELQDVAESIKHLEQQKAEVDATLLAELECEVAARTPNSIESLEACTRVLESAGQLTPRSISYAWTLAIRKGNQERARELVAKARAAGMPAPALARMQEATQRSGSLGDRWQGIVGQLTTRGKPLGLLLAVILAMLAATFGLAALSRSRRRPRSSA